MQKWNQRGSPTLTGDLQVKLCSSVHHEEFPAAAAALHPGTVPLRDYFWLCTLEFLLAVRGGPHGKPGIGTGLTACKADALGFPFSPSKGINTRVPETVTGKLGWLLKGSGIVETDLVWGVRNAQGLAVGQCCPTL